GPTEIVTEVRVPKLTGAHGWSFLKFRRRAQDWATVGVAVVVKRRNGGAESAAISLVNMGATPLRARAAEEAVVAGDDPGAVVDGDCGGWRSGPGCRRSARPWRDRPSPRRLRW